MNVKMMNKILIWILCFAMIMPSLPLESISFAATTITSVKYNTTYDEFNVEEGFIQIRGTELSGVDVTIEDLDGKPYTPANKSIDTDPLILIDLSIDEANNFNGVIYVGSERYDFGSSTFPQLLNTDIKNVNYEKPTPDNLVLRGTSLDNVSVDGSKPTTDVLAYFGQNKDTLILNNNPTNTEEQLTITNPKPLSSLPGYQDIWFERETTVPGGAVVSVTSRYKEAFRLIGLVGVTNPEMFPNMGAHEDTVYFTANDFETGEDYTAYFLKDLSGGDDYKDMNRAEFVALSKDIDGSQDKLTVTVPPRIAGEDKFDIGTYYVVLAIESGDDDNRQIIAEQTVFKPGTTTADEYTIVESRFRPQIENVTPNEGPDLGSLTTIVGSNVLEIDLPGLTVENNVSGYTTAASDTELTATYLNGTYGTANIAVEIKRTFKVQIGKLATFDTGDYTPGLILKDHLPVTTGVITDADTDPVKDVQVEIITTLVEEVSRKEYVFKQTAILVDGYTFLESTLLPEVTEVVPNTVQAIQKGTYYIPKEETLLTIKGSNFLVDRVVENNVVYTRMPAVLFKKTVGDIDFTKYQIGFFPARSAAAPNSQILFRYNVDGDGIAELPGEVETPKVLVNNDGPIEMEMTVLDDNNKVVDGTSGNDIGTKIVIRVPNDSTQSYLGDIGKKQVQVVNPTRNSPNFGKVGTLTEEFEFKETTDNPIIESVEPNIVTVAGGESVKIKGSNFQEDMKIYLAGEEITNFTRELDPLGTKYIITFTAPAGTEGITQIQVINPSAGMDVRDFSYVKSFNDTPQITNFTPEKGTSSTLVVVNGLNYLQADTSVSNTEGVNGFRLIGTRVTLDGNDVNNYEKDGDGNIVFKEYLSPNSDYQILNYSADQAVWSPFIDNAYIVQTLPIPEPDQKLFVIGNDANRNPMITDNHDDTFFFTYNSATSIYSVHRPAEGDDAEMVAPLSISGPGANTSPGITTLSFTMDGTNYTFTASLDNNILRSELNEDGNVVPKIADYVDSVIFTRQDNNGNNYYYILEERVNGDVVFTNNSDLTYFITYNKVTGKIEANENNKDPVTLVMGKEPSSIPSEDQTTLTIDHVKYTILNPYIKNLTTREITGDHTRIINTEQLSFDVPLLETGTGYKDLVVINPDTKSAEKRGKNGFYYIKQSSSHPIISEIMPDEGSIDGGYIIKITGSDFEDDMSVYIDSVLVPTADTYVSLDGDYVTVKVPKCIKDLQGDFGVSELSVPVVVLNQDGGSDSKNDGFTYVVPVSNPRIDQIILEDGSANGGETVQILGYDFRYFEPYEDSNELDGYNHPIDPFTDLYKNGKWDDLLAKPMTDPTAIKDVPIEHPKFDYYKESPILPTVFFGEREAKIVEYKKGFIKVIAPDHEAGQVLLYVVNNDQGVSNSVTYTYTSSAPTITDVSPNKGNRTGQEFKDIYGKDFYRSELKGYANNNENAIVTLDNLGANVRFADVDNLEISVGESNDGLINAGRAEVSLSGDLTAIYDSDNDTVELQVIENGKTYKRTFNNYDDSNAYFPMEMLRNGSVGGPYEYYHPSGYSVADTSIWNNKIYEYIKVSIKDRRLFVERGYAPNVQYISGTRLTVVSPSYHTIDTVPLTVTNNDGGQGVSSFTYTNPDSQPKILEVNPYKLSVSGNYYEVQSSIQGGIEIEVVGLDFRDDVVVNIGTKVAEIIEETTRVINEVTYDVLILRVPQGEDADVDQKYPIVIENTDAGMANSTTLKDLVIPSGASSPIPFFFVYRKPLSGPEIFTIEPIETSVYGGNEVVITGRDIREGALVIIGTSGGVPITNGVVSDEGTKLTIQTPTGMTLGDKTVQVINKDFGTASLNKGLKIVSFPTVVEEILTEDGKSSAVYVNVEGGDVVMVKGTGFVTGAKVFFGSNRTSHKTKPTADIVGLFKDDTYIELKDGYEATGVTVVDENTILVTTPEIPKEDIFNITVLNSDGGISEDNANLNFSEPVPTKPKGLRVRVIDDRYIQLYEYTSDGVEYYEVYYYLGAKSSGEIFKNNRHDMKYLGTTTLEPYKVNRIPGFENRRPNDVLYFALKAVNKYGVSSWSNFAVLNYNQLKEVTELGPEDVDGDLGVPKGQEYVYDSDGTTSVINLSEDALKKEVLIDLRGIEEGNPAVRRINVPQEMVKISQSVILVDYVDSKLQFIPVGLNTPEFKELGFYDRTYGRITTSTAGNSYNSMLKLSLPRGKKAATKIFTLETEVISNEESKVINRFSAPMDIQLKYDATYLTEAHEASLQLYRYDKALDKWELMSATVDRNKKLVTVRTNKPGSFVVLYER